MEKTTNEEAVIQTESEPMKVLTKKVWFNAVKLFGKIAFAIIFSLFYFIAMIFYVSPKTGAKIFSFFGSKKAEETCYIRIYDESQNNADLYNLILFESELENYEKELYYLNLLMNNDEYEDFCSKLDESALETINESNIETLVYVCNTKAYLINQKVKCMYNLGFDKGLSVTVKNYLKSMLEGDFVFETSFLTYVELVYNDATITKDEKKNKINAVYESMESLLHQKLVFLNEFNLTVNVTVKDKIISQYTYAGVKKAQYMVDLINENGNVSSSKLDYENALKAYKALFNDLFD